MLQGCVYGAAGTIFQRLYVQCRIVGLPRLLAHDDVLRCAASYRVIRAPQGGMPEYLRVGRTDSCMTSRFGLLRRRPSTESSATWAPRRRTRHLADCLRTAAPLTWRFRRSEG